MEGRLVTFKDFQRTLNTILKQSQSSILSRTFPLFSTQIEATAWAHLHHQIEEYEQLKGGRLRRGLEDEEVRARAEKWFRKIISNRRRQFDKQMKKMMVFVVDDLEKRFIY